MNPWICALAIAAAGGFGGVVNAFLSNNGFVLPRREHNVWCPGAISNILIGALAAFSSWALYGSGASVDLSQITERTAISLRFSALAGAFFVGIAGSRWLTNEVDKKLLKESVVEAATKNIPREKCEKIVKGPARQVLEEITNA